MRTKKLAREDNKQNFVIEKIVDGPEDRPLHVSVKRFLQDEERSIERQDERYFYDDDETFKVVQYGDRLAFVQRKRGNVELEAESGINTLSSCVKDRRTYRYTTFHRIDPTGRVIDFSANSPARDMSCFIVQYPDYYHYSANICGKSYLELEDAGMFNGWRREATAGMKRAVVHSLGKEHGRNGIVLESQLKSASRAQRLDVLSQLYSRLVSGDQSICPDDDQYVDSVVTNSTRLAIVRMAADNLSSVGLPYHARRLVDTSTAYMPERFAKLFVG